MPHPQLQRGAVVDTGLLAARILLQIGAPRLAAVLGWEAGVGEDVWNCALMALSGVRIYTTVFALAEAFGGIIERRWPYAVAPAQVAVAQLNASGDLEEVAVDKASIPPGGVGFVDGSLIAAAVARGVPLVTYDMGLWQFGRGLADVLTIYELCGG
jgi:hypothetical protein